ncbi:MAG: glycosyltransferase family 4 protein [Candidatus Planktophila sp.]|nr:glycosyltransferase family 4 protein [Candidatus Planktophila sp.]
MELVVSSPVLFVTNDFGPRAGGIETFVIGLIERRDFGSTIVYTSAQEDADVYDAMWREKYGVTVIRDRSKILLPTPRVARRLAHIIKGENIVVAAFGAAAPLGLLSASMKRAGVQKTIALTHGHEVWWAKVFPFNLAMRRIASTVDTLTFLGDFTRRAISKSVSSKSAKRMVRIAPGIDVDHFSPVDSTELRKELNLEGKKVIVSVGRLVHRKGQDHLIESMPEIIKFVPNAHLLMVGKGPYLDYLAKLVAINKLEDHVSFIGRIQYAELPQFICAGDVFAMPSRSRLAGLEVEGLGIVYLEASACGLPVVAGSSGGAPDAVVQGVTGIVVDGTNNTEIADAIVALLNNPEEAEKMGAAGRQWVIDNWRWEIWSTRFNKLLEQ